MPLNFKKHWPCDNECSCSLCRELQKPEDGPTPLGFFRSRDKKKTNSKKKLKGAAPADEPPNDNFILKRGFFDFRQISMMELSASSNIKKSLSYQEITKKLEASFQNHQKNLSQRMNSTSNLMHDISSPMRPSASTSQIGKAPEHRTVIYFGDSFKKNDDNKLKLIKVDTPKVEEAYHARRLCEELQFSRQGSIRKSKNFSALYQKAECFASQQQILRPTKPAPPPPPPAITLNNGRKSTKTVNSQQIHIGNTGAEVVSVSEAAHTKTKVDQSLELVDTGDTTLPPFIESVVNGVINIRIEDNYEVASQIVRSLHERAASGGTDIELSDEDDVYEDDFDWSFVQEWRSR